RGKRIVARDTRIQDYPVMRTMLSDIAFDPFPALLTVNQVELYYSAITAEFFDRSKGLIHAIAIAVIMRDHRESIPRDSNGNGASDSFACTGDKDRSAHVTYPHRFEITGLPVETLS